MGEDGFASAFAFSLLWCLNYLQYSMHMQHKTNCMHACRPNPTQHIPIDVLIPLLDSLYIHPSIYPRADLPFGSLFLSCGSRIERDVRETFTESSCVRMYMCIASSVVKTCTSGPPLLLLISFRYLSIGFVRSFPWSFYSDRSGYSRGPVPCHWEICCLTFASRDWRDRSDSSRYRVR